MKQVLTTFLLVLTLTAWGQKIDFDYQRDFKSVLEQTKNSASTLAYNKLLKRFASNDTTLTDYEVLALLIGFTDHPNFKPYSYLSTELDIFSLNRDGQYQKALDLCNSFLVQVPVSQSTLLDKSYALYKLNQVDSSRFYSWRFQKIMDAMGQSGDGLSMETSLFSLGPADGQNFIRQYLQNRIGTMGSGRDQNGNFVDILEMIWKDQKTGEERRRNLYFQIQHASKTMFSDLSLDKHPNKHKKRNKK